jgi:hypothetical protein
MTVEALADRCLSAIGVWDTSRPRHQLQSFKIVKPSSLLWCELRFPDETNTKRMNDYGISPEVDAWEPMR